MAACPCDSGKPETECCGPLLTRSRAATSPEELMRSRYCAFVKKDIGYIADTTDPQADFDRAAAEEWMNASEFSRLEVLNATNEGNKGVVEFKAHYTAAGEKVVHHEVSKFRKAAGVWYFRDGRVKEVKG